MGKREEWEEDREKSTRVGMRAREGTAFWADISSAHLRGAKMSGPIAASLPQGSRHRRHKFLNGETMEKLPGYRGYVM